MGRVFDYVFWTLLIVFGISDVLLYLGGKLDSFQFLTIMMFLIFTTAVKRFEEKS